MPIKTKSGKWRWGNIVRDNKKELAQAVYGVWKRNGSKGDFGKFFKSGKIKENEDNFLQFNKVPKSKLTSLLDLIEAYCENERFSRLLFEKYLESKKKIDLDSIYYGVFENGKCLALSYLNKTPKSFVLLAQVSSIVHGYGAMLISDIIARSKNFWLAADPDGGEKLILYYRQFDLSEHIILHSKWVDGRMEYVFYKANDNESEERLLNMLEEVEMQ